MAQNFVSDGDVIPWTNTTDQPVASGQPVVLNDINGELVSLYRCVRHHLDEFVRMFRWSLVSRQMFEWVQMERPEALADIQRTARFYYL